jgi:hypothetical protein
MFASEKRSWRIGGRPVIFVKYEPNDHEVMRLLNDKLAAIESGKYLANRTIDYQKMRYKLRRKIRIARRLWEYHSKGLRGIK